MAIVAALALACAACGHSSTGEEGVKVSGSAWYKGKPMPGAMVFFYTSGGAAGDRQHAVVDDDGNYQVTLKPGRYDAAITWTKPAKGDNEGDSLIPWWYGDPKSSKLGFDVTEATTTLPPIELR